MRSVPQSVVSQLPGRDLVDVHDTPGRWTWTVEDANIGLHTARRRAQNRASVRGAMVKLHYYFGLGLGSVLELMAKLRVRVKVRVRVRQRAPMFAIAPMKLHVSQITRFGDRQTHKKSPPLTRVATGG